jgi:hypothetical protein
LICLSEAYIIYPSNFYTKERIKKKAINPVIIIMLSALLIIVIPGCKNGEASQDTETSPQQETETMQEEPAQEEDVKEAEGEEEAGETAEEDTEGEEDPGEVPEGVDETAIYNIKFEAVWSSETHPGYYESSAHFSPFVIYSYNGADEGRTYTLGSPSSPGMEDMAETGATGKLEEEIGQLIEDNYALAYTKAKVFDSPGQVEATIEFTPEFSQFIFVTMIAPSPDWFVAAEGDVFVEGQWIDELVLEVMTYDAGTDSGETLTAANSDTDPKEPVAIFDDYLQELGTLTVTRN